MGSTKNISWQNFKFLKNEAIFYVFRFLPKTIRKGIQNKQKNKKSEQKRRLFGFGFGMSRSLYAMLMLGKAFWLLKNFTWDRHFFKLCMKNVSVLIQFK